MLIYQSLLIYALKCYIVKYFYLITYFSGLIFIIYVITKYGAKIMKSTKNKAVIGVHDLANVIP
jgi:hypothetical protein